MPPPAVRYRQPKDLNVDGRRAVWAFQMGLPLALFWLLHSDPLIDQSKRDPDAHFAVVSAAAVVGLLVAAVVAHGCAKPSRRPGVPDQPGPVLDRRHLLDALAVH
jgi:hypothetical protein